MAVGHQIIKFPILNEILKRDPTMSLFTSASTPATQSASSASSVLSITDISAMMASSVLSSDPSPSSDHLSSTLTEVRIEIYKRCDAFTLFLNWDNASMYMPSSTRVPSAIEIWIAFLQSDHPEDDPNIKLPLIDRGTKYSDGEQFCLPDVAVLCKFIKSKSMLQRIYDCGLPVSDDFFNHEPPCPRHAVHVAMRHCWLDMIDVWNLTDQLKEDYAIKYSHWNYFQHLVALRPDLNQSIHDYFDHAAQNGELEWLQSFSNSITGTKSAMNLASANGHLSVVKWLHVNRPECCIMDEAMEYAASRGHLDVVEWLHENMNEGHCADSMFQAAQ